MKILKKCQLAYLVHPYYCYSLHFVIFTQNNFVVWKRNELKKNARPGFKDSSYSTDQPRRLDCVGWVLIQEPKCGKGSYHQPPFPDRLLLPREGASVWVLMLQGADAQLGWLKSVGFSCSSTCPQPCLILFCGTEAGRETQEMSPVPGVAPAHSCPSVCF